MTQSQLPKCRHRGSQVAPGRWFCDSTKLVIPGRVVTADICRSMCPYVDHEVDALALQSLPDTNGKPNPRMPVDEFIDRIAESSKAFPKGWQWWEVAQSAHRKLINDAANHSASYPGGFEGHGIVIAAGGPTYFPCAYVCVSVLRSLGCTLPVEFWHLGPEELNQQMAELVEPLGVACRNAYAIEPQPRRLKGWELKPFSVLHSRFREVLYLDADNVPVIDPTYLFDDARYRESGAVFWPDLPPAGDGSDWIPDLTWDVAGIAWRDGPAFESGQYLVDKSKCWRELSLTMHINEHSDFWYRYVYGDKDTFKLAWHKLDRTYAVPATPAGWNWPAILQYDLDGRLLFTHACQGKGQLKTGERLTALPQSQSAVEAARELQRNWNGKMRSPWTSNHTVDSS